MKKILALALFLGITSAHAQLDYHPQGFSAMKEVQENGVELLQMAEDGDKSAQNLMAVAASFIAKETCSCLFVSQLPKDICKENMPRLPINIVPKVDPDTKTVTASIMLFKQTAKVKGANLGCVLIRKP